MMSVWQTVGLFTLRTSAALDPSVVRPQLLSLSMSRVCHRGPSSPQHLLLTGFLSLLLIGRVTNRELWMLAKLLSERFCCHSLDRLWQQVWDPDTR